MSCYLGLEFVRPVCKFVCSFSNDNPHVIEPRLRMDVCELHIIIEDVIFSDSGISPYTDKCSNCCMDIVCKQENNENNVVNGEPFEDKIRRLRVLVTIVIHLKSFPRTAD